MPALADRAARRLADAPRWRFGNWLSAHYPFVWRTRALFVVMLGVLATVGAGAYAMQADVRRETLPTLTESLSFLWTWALVAEGAVLLLVVDVVWRSRPIVGRDRLIRLAACVLVSTVALLIPEYVFINLYVPRIAGLESDDTIAVHRQNGFWRCVDDSQAFEPLRTRVVNDLYRYGFTTDGLYAGYGCDASGQYSLRVRKIGAPDYMGMTTSLFEGRLLHVDAARQYTRHEGAYEGAALGHAVNIVWTSALAGVLAALFTSAQTRGVWTSLVAFVKRQRRGHGGPAIGRDAWLAARLPTVWSSRVRTSTPHLLIVPGLLLLMSSEVLPGSRAGWILAPVVVAAIFAACRNQEVARYRPSRSRIDITVLMIHFSVLCAAATVVYWLMQSTQRDAAAQFMVTLWGITVWCAFLQGTRSTSTLTAFGGIAIVGITAAGVAFAMWLVGTQIGSWLMTLVPVGRVGVVEGLIMFTGAVATVLLLMALLAFARRIEARSSLQRVVVASLITSSPIPAVLATIAFVMPQPKDITVARAGLSLLLALASTAVCLMMTDTTRRRLAGSTR